ncbi:MAG: uroporphyrinogen-III synthase [Planctomycetota bacterium]
MNPQNNPSTALPPLTDRWRVWVTRDEDARGPLSSALEVAGRAPVLAPVLQIASLAEPDALVVPLTDLTPDDWLVLTSARAVEALPRIGTRARVGVVGPATRRAAEALGLKISLESRDGTAAGLWKEIDRRAGRVRILFPRSELAEVPTLAGVEISAPVVYGTRPRAFDVSVATRVDAAAFASPSAVHAAADVLRAHPLITLSIGPTTSDALLSIGVRDVREAKSPTFSALARTL